MEEQEGIEKKCRTRTRTQARWWSRIGQLCLLVSPGARLRRNADCAGRSVAPGKPICIGFPERAGKGGYVNPRKASVAVIEENCDRPSKPSGSQDQINGVVSIDIPRCDLKAARRGENVNGLRPGCRELKLNPVVGMGGAAVASLNSG